MAFGKTGVQVDLPEGFQYRILDTLSAESLPDTVEALEKALDSPIASPPLFEMAKGKSSAAISVCDITRPAPNRQVLPPILDRLERAGIPQERITILIATGLHRPASEHEIVEILGEQIARTYRVVNHNARQLSEHRYLGTTSSGIPVHIDERFVAADLHLSLGFIEPHFMLGFSGGRKLVCPGLAARETIVDLHSPKYMRDLRAVEGCIADNLLHQQLIEIAGMARHDFIADVALARHRSIAGVFAGDPVEAHRSGVEFVSQTMLQVLEEPVDAAITTSAGYPLDLTFYQTVKGVFAASHMVKPGGSILLLAACDEGAGAPEFRQMLKDYPSDREFMEKTANAPVTIDQWQLEKLALVTMDKKVFFYVPGLPAEYHSSLWGKACASLPAAIEEFSQTLSPGASVAVIPEGPYVLGRTRAQHGEAKAAN